MINSTSRGVDMEYKLNRWQHPKSGETRIYVNADRMKAKVWIVTSENYDDRVDVFSRANSRYDFPGQSQARSQGLRSVDDFGFFEAEKALNERGIDLNVASFDDVLAVAI